MSRKISIRLNAREKVSGTACERWIGIISIGMFCKGAIGSKSGRLTSYENVLVRCAHELHGFLSEERHVFIDGIVGDILVGTVVEGDEDVEENCQALALTHWLIWPS